MGKINSLRLVGAPGTNKIMAGELSRLARRAIGGRMAEPKKAGGGTLIYPFDRQLAELAVHYHRTSARVLWDLAESTAERLEPLYDDLCQALKGDQRGWLWDGATISVRARNVGGFAAGEPQVIGTVKNAIIDTAKEDGIEVTVERNEPDVLIHARLHNDVISVSVDLAGRTMAKRGYRTEGAGEAPLREDRAATVAMLSRYDARSEVLIDPMCGSGTIAIEAALMGRGVPLWVAPRAPTIYRLPAFRDRVGQTHEPLFGDTKPVVIANDIHTPVIELARGNIQRAGVADAVHLLHGDFRDLSRKRIDKVLSERGHDGKRGVIVCNPPYGTRMGGPELEQLYRDLGAWCAGFPGWRAAFIVANPDFVEHFGRRPRISKPLSNGPQKGYFYSFDL